MFKTGYYRLSGGTNSWVKVHCWTNPYLLIGSHCSQTLDDSFDEFSSLKMMRHFSKTGLLFSY